jgi:hypothetical protein
MASKMASYEAEVSRVKTRQENVLERLTKIEEDTETLKLTSIGYNEHLGKRR